MDEMHLFYRIFEGMDRLGPGADRYTRRALERVREQLPGQPRILDLGCGTGAQTLVLAEQSSGQVVALDNHAPFLDILLERAQKAGVSERVETRLADLHQPLPFEEGSFDLIWSEGSAYILGLSTALKAWKPLLRPGGCLVVSDNRWVRRSDSEEVRAFWQEESPEMLDLRGTRRRIERCGYQVLDHFRLPGEVWNSHYYAPLRERLRTMREDEGVELPAEIVEALEYEMYIFDQAKGSYAYEFWVLALPISD